MLLQIPIPATLGYINLGDTMIFVVAILFSPVTAMISGGIGSALADVLLGYTQWALFTLIIKGLEGLICGLIIVKFRKIFIDGRLVKTMSLVAMISGGLVMIVGYFFGGWILFGTWQSSIVSVPQYLIQAVASVVLGYVVVFILKLIKMKEYFK